MCAYFLRDMFSKLSGSRGSSLPSQATMSVRFVHHTIVSEAFYRKKNFGCPVSAHSDATYVALLSI